MKPLLTLPCRNKHSDMEKKEAGYHCKSCDHVLTDFRNSSEEEIQTALQSNKGKICGVFNSNQFDYKISQVQIPAFRAVGLSLLGILGFLGPVITSCESENTATEQKQNAFNLLRFPMHIKGSVNDEQTGKPLPFFTVEVMQFGKVIKTVKTDRDGNFEILIRKDDLKQEIFRLAIGGKDYQKDTLISNINDYPANGKVRLTIRAEANSKLRKKGNCSPETPHQWPVEGRYIMTTAGIPACPDPPAPEKVFYEEDEPEILKPVEYPTIVTQYKPGKTRKIKPEVEDRKKRRKNREEN